MAHSLVPKLLSVFREGYTWRDLGRDLTAGAIVGILALPMSIAFAIASGARPEQGLYTAIIAGFLAGLFSGSRYQVTGPTGAFIVLVLDTYTRHGYDGLVIATMMAGILLIAMGLMRCGAAIKFIPYPVVIGFTSGIALLIFSTQIADFTGMSGWSIDTLHPPTLALSLFALGIVVFWPRVSSAIPGALIAILLTTALAHLFDMPVATIGQRYGSVELCIPCLKLPQIELDRVLGLVSPAIAIALLAGIESLLSAVVADGMTGRRHRSDMELISQGIANIGSALFGGIPATGAIARTAANIKSGAVSPISTIAHAITLLLLLYFFGTYVAMIPMAALSAILVFVAYNMSEWRHFVRLFRSPPGDVAVLLLTFFLTVFVDLVTGIEVGVIFAAFLFIYRMSQATHVKDMKELTAEQDDPRDYQTLADLAVPDAVQVFEVFGSLSFGAVESFEAALQRLQVVPKVLILRMRHVLTLDATGIRALTAVLDKAQRDHTTVLFTGVHPRLLEVLVRCGIAERLGAAGIQPNLPAAVTHAKRLLK